MYSMGPVSWGNPGLNLFATCMTLGKSLNLLGPQWETGISEYVED